MVISTTSWTDVSLRAGCSVLKLKRNWGFRRFLLRGFEKVDHEMRMVAMGHNIRKMAYALAV